MISLITTRGTDCGINEFINKFEFQSLENGYAGDFNSKNFKKSNSIRITIVKIYETK